ncbi:MAG TPA: GNAT family protein [Trebonia sp.]|nr:GNAT family protein [Trebonia sp.]
MTEVGTAPGASMRMTVQAALPLLGLRISAGPVELRGITDDLLGPLADLAVEGIDSPGAPPFLTPWKTGPPRELPRFLAQYYWQLRAGFSPDRWTASLAVLWDGEPAGVQELFGENYLISRTTETGSWLARRFHGQGIGTIMRQVAAAFAFDHLDAHHVTSSAFSDNAASVAVSRKVGYKENGVDIWPREGQPVPHLRFLLSPGDLVRYEHPLDVTGLPAFRRSIGLAADG